MCFAFDDESALARSGSMGVVARCRFVPGVFSSDICPASYSTFTNPGLWYFGLLRTCSSHYCGLAAICRTYVFAAIADFSSGRPPAGV